MNPLLKAFAPINALPHIYQILGVFAAAIAVFLFCYGLANNGLLDIAATAISYFILQLLALMGPKFSQNAPREFRQTANALDVFLSELAEWRMNQKLLAKGLLAAFATAGFLVIRYLATLILPLIADPWFAAALGVGITACVISPALVRGVIDTFKEKNNA